MQNNDITVFISTRGRSMSTLPHTVMSICQQSVKPKALLILDDDFRDLRGEFIWQHIFSLLQYYGIEWIHEPGSKSGQVANHIRSLEMVKTDFIFRIDDDVVLELDCLEKLAKHIGDKVGAIAPLVTNKGYVLSEYAKRKDDVNFLRRLYGRRTSDYISLRAAEPDIRKRWNAIPNGSHTLHLLVAPLTVDVDKTSRGMKQLLLSEKKLKV